jgi:hypothetical protein
MTTVYVALFIATFASGLQATLERSGIGRIEAMSRAAVIVSLPLIWTSNLGLIVVLVWSLVVLPLLPTVSTFLAAFICAALALTSISGPRRGNGLWRIVADMGVPLVFFLRLIASVAIGYLAFAYVSKSVPQLNG